MNRDAISQALLAQLQNASGTGFVNFGQVTPLSYVYAPLFIDNFLRSDENPLNPQNYSIFGTPPTALQIVSNRCVATVLGSDCDELFTGIPVFPPDQYAAITIGQVAGAAGIFVRSSLSGDTGYVVDFGPIGTNCQISLMVNLSQPLGSFTGTVNPGDVIQLTAVGSTISVQLNEVTIISVNEVTLSSGIPGMFIGAAASTSDTWISQFVCGSVMATVPSAGVPQVKFGKLSRAPAVWTNTNIAEMPAAYLFKISELVEPRQATGLTRYILNFVLLIYLRSDPSDDAVGEVQANQILDAFNAAMLTQPYGGPQTLDNTPQVIDAWIEGECFIDPDIINNQMSMNIPIKVLVGAF